MHNLHTLLETLGMLPLKTDPALLQKIAASVNTGAINNAKAQNIPYPSVDANGLPIATGGKTMAELMEEHRRKLQAALTKSPEVFYDPATRTQTVVQPNVVERITVDVQLEAPQESEADRIMRITREMACG